MTKDEYVKKSIGKAIREKYFKVYYQPIIRSINQKLCSFEALARWDDPIYGMLSPGYFIPLLEESRQIYLLDLYVIKEVCRQMRECIDRGMEPIPVSINLSRQDFEESDIAREIDHYAAKYDIDRSLLSIEITETVISAAPDLIKEQLLYFQKKGHQVWMDDFGSGYSTLNILKDYPFDQIKLDMNFMSSMSERSKLIISSLVDMTKKIGIQTLMEGVETEEAFQFLREIGCEKVQGYYFGKPLPFDEALKNLEQKGITFETKEWKEYYDVIGKVDFMTDKPVAIMEFDGQIFAPLYCNEAYKELWRKVGVVNVDKMEGYVNAPVSPLHRLLEDFQKRLLPGVEDSIEYILLGHYIRALGKGLGAHGDHVAALIEVNDLTKGDDEKKRDRMENVLRLMYAMFDAIYLIDLKNDSVESVLQGAFSQIPKYQEFLSVPFSTKGRQIAAKLCIDEKDQEEFLEFTAQESIKEYITKPEKGYITKYFRTITCKGDYVWKAHHVIFVPGEEVVVYAVNYAPLEEGVVHKLDLEQVQKLLTED